MELLSPLIILPSEIIDLPLVITHCHQELGVGLLSCKELMNYLLNICKPCGSSDLLESILYFISALHLLFHLAFKVRAP
jgi:hypothetical protein